MRQPQGGRGVLGALDQNTHPHSEQGAHRIQIYFWKILPLTRTATPGALSQRRSLAPNAWPLGS